MRRLLISAALVSLLPSVAPAQQRLGWLDLIAPDRILQQMVQFGIMTLRTQMDVKYGDISVDLMTGRITLTDVAMWPLPDWDTNGDCEVRIDRLTVRGGSLDRIDRLRLKAQVSGLTAPIACLPPEAQQGMGMAEIDTLDVPRLTLDVDYGVPGSDAVARVFGIVENAAAIDLTARFAYVWVDGRQDMEEPDPVVFLENARLTIENRGIWDALKGQIPPPFADPASAAQAIEGAIGGALAEMNRENAPEGASGDPSALSDSQRAFLDSVVAAWPAFLASPATLVLETALDSDAYLDFVAMEDDPRLAFDTLMPRLALAPAQIDQTLPVAMLQQAMGADLAAMPDADRKAIGLAMITGVGAPRNLEAGFDLLNPLALAGDGEAALAISVAGETAAPEEAYKWALVAGRMGETGATARLDRLEKRIGFARVLELQNQVSGDDVYPVDALQSVSAIRDQASMRLSGNGQARSYGVAAMWAMLGKALGDPESADILADIDERIRLGGPSAQEAWIPAEQEASKLALESWMGEDLPARFAR